MKPAVLLATLTLLAQAQSARIHPEVTALLQTKPTAPVFILLKDQPQRDIAARFPRETAYAEMERAVAPQQTRLEAKLITLGASNVGRYTVINLLTAEIPASALADLESDPDVASVFLAKNRYADLQNSVPLLGAPAFWNVGITGASQSVAVVDTGVATGHPAFAGVPIISRVFLNFGKTSACFDDDATTAEDYQGHGTHVAGIVASRGSAGFTGYIGVAKGLSTLYNLKAAYKSKISDTCGSQSGVGDDRDVIQALQWAAANTPSRILNLSFGSDTTTDDDNFAQLVDQIADVNNAFIAVAAGNGGPAASTLSSPGIGYNVVTVANASSATTINSSSSRGPTLGGRNKPDIAAPGTSIVSTAFDWATAGQPAFVSKTGTSMSTPHIAGAAALLRQAGITNPLSMKAVLLNSTGATDWQPDRGWGFANLNTTVSQTAFVDSNSVAPGTYAFYRVSSPGAMTATLVWNRHLPGTFSDLDLYSYGVNSNALLSQSITGDQNVEKVAPQSDSDVVLKVRSEATGTTSETFSLAASRSLARATGPVLSLLCAQSSRTILNNALSSTCTVTNQGDMPAFNVTLTATSPDRTDAWSAGTLQPGASASHTTSFLSSSTGSKAYNVAASSTSYGETISAAATYAIAVIVDPNLPSAPTGPNPTLSATGVNTTGILSWNAASQASSYDVLLGTTNPPAAFASNLTGTSVPYSSLAANTTYYWQVVARNSFGTTASDVWQFTTGANAIPEVLGYASSNNTLTFTFSDANGVGDLGVVNVLINLFLDGRNACYIAYDSKANVLYLVGDNGSSLTGAALPSFNVLTNSQCSISTSGVMVAKAGNLLTLTVPYTFTPAFGAATNGSKILYAAARDTEAANSGWQPMGAFRVAVPTTNPMVISASPAAGSGGVSDPTPITVTYRDAVDSRFLQPAQILINNGLDGRSACYVGFDHTGNSVSLVKDDGTGLIPGTYIRLNGAAGGSASIENSQCKIYAAGSTYSDSGQVLTLTLSVQFKAAFAGKRIVYAGVQTITGGNSDWAAIGSWILP